LTVRDQESYEGLGRFVESALSMLTGKLGNGESMPSAEFDEIVIDETGYLSVRKQVKGDILQFIERHFAELRAFPQYNQAVESLLKSDIVTRHIEKHASRQKDKTSIKPYVEISLVRKFLFQLAQDAQSLEFNRFRFDRLYGALEEFLIADEIQYIILAVIPLVKLPPTTPNNPTATALEASEATSPPDLP